MNVKLLNSRAGPIDGVEHTEDGSLIDVAGDAHAKDLAAVRLLQLDIGDGLGIEPEEMACTW